MTNPGIPETGPSPGAAPGRPTLDVAIVNWNSGRQLGDCLQSLVETDRHPLNLGRVVVVDNASADDSAAGFGGLPLPLTVVRNAENRGFAAACNQAAAGSSAAYLLFLNPDVRLFRDSLSGPVDYIERSENGRVAALAIQLVDEAGVVSRDCVRFPTAGMLLAESLGLSPRFPRLFKNMFMVDWDHSETREVDHVKAAFLLIRRPAFEAVGGFDERYFLYMEDLDLSLQLHRAGWKSVYYAGARAYHRGGGTSEQVKAARQYHCLRARIQYGCKNFGWWPAAMLMAGILFLVPVLHVGYALLHYSRDDRRETVAAYRMLWRAVPSLLREARPSRRRADATGVSSSSAPARKRSRG